MNNIKTENETANQVINELYEVNPVLSEREIFDMALYVCSKVLSETPMYTGNLNYKWKIYNDAKFELLKAKSTN